MFTVVARVFVGGFYEISSWLLRCTDCFMVVKVFEYITKHESFWNGCPNLLGRLKKTF